MKLVEAKQILKNNGYRLTEGSMSLKDKIDNAKAFNVDPDEEIWVEKWKKVGNKAAEAKIKVPSFTNEPTLYFKFIAKAGPDYNYRDDCADQYWIYDMNKKKKVYVYIDLDAAAPVDYTVADALEELGYDPDAYPHIMVDSPFR